MALDDLVGRNRSGKAQGQRRGGRVVAPRRAGGRDEPYMNTGGMVHKAGASLEEVAAAGDNERCEEPLHYVTTLSKRCGFDFTTHRHARRVLKIGANTQAKTVAVRGTGVSLLCQRVGSRRGKSVTT